MTPEPVDLPQSISEQNENPFSVQNYEKSQFSCNSISHAKTLVHYNQFKVSIHHLQYMLKFKFLISIDLLSYQNKLGLHKCLIVFLIHIFHEYLVT